MLQIASCGGSIAELNDPLAPMVVCTFSVIAETGSMVNTMLSS